MHGVVATRRRYAIFLLSVCLLSSLPQTVLNVPDPLWVAGAYDGADLDDLVLANAGNGLGATPDVVAIDVQPHRTDRRLASAESAHFVALGPPAVGLRAPPFLY
jgi:hypothetical protein